MATSARTERRSPPMAERPSRVVVEGVAPQVDCGRFPAKRTVGEKVLVEADVYAEGHDVVAAALRYRRDSETAWTELPMEPIGNDRWRAAFRIEALEPYAYAVEGWVDPFLTWRRGLGKKLAAEQVEAVDLLVGAQLVEEAVARAKGEDAPRLRAAAAAMRGAPSPKGWRRSWRATRTAARRGASASSWR